VDRKSGSKKLVVLHIDGLGADTLERALRDGKMPNLQKLIDDEGYEIHRYRCGLPSTTPFAQAGILYGDNSEIPCFRWWDRERQVVVQFGTRSTFKKVADKYFEGCQPLTEDGACIATCYPAGAADDFGIAYQDRSYGRQPRSRSAWNVLLPYLANPIHLGDWIWQILAVLVRTVRDYATARLHGRHPARTYVAVDAAEEMFVHHLTRYAVEKAMREGYSPIYAGFYAFDEVAHAFGPEDLAAGRMLNHVDHTIHKIAKRRDGAYELVVLSDHGQIETTPFAASYGKAFGEVVSGLLPGFRVQQVEGKTFGPEEEDAAGKVLVTSSGGASHLYFAGRGSRMSHSELEAAHAGLARALARLPQVSLVSTRDGEHDVFTSAGGELRGAAVKPLLATYDDPEILLGQLSRLNSFHHSGDMIVFGSFIDGKQINFEDQAGGHGSIGGEQLHPFVLAKKEWALDTSSVNSAQELHPLLCRLRDRLAGLPQEGSTPRQSSART
jgi:Type I phosphodiesterase / nucleotide pyrophosphatase